MKVCLIGKKNNVNIYDLEEYTATLKVGDEVTIKYYSITGEKEIKEKF